jgi:hypothetical protein
MLSVDMLQLSLEINSEALLTPAGPHNAAVFVRSTKYGNRSTVCNFGRDSQTIPKPL